MKARIVEFLLTLVYKAAKVTGLIPETVCYDVTWICAQDHKCYVLTPFNPGRQPSNYGDQKGIQPGDKGIATIEMVVVSGPSRTSFVMETK